MSTSEDNSTPPKKAPLLFLVIFIGVILLIWFRLPSFSKVIQELNSTQPPVGMATTAPDETTGPNSPISGATIEVSGNISAIPAADEAGGTIIFSMSDGQFAHLFAFQPDGFSISRLTNNAWDDIDPAISPDGAQLAFSSRRNGYWDIYIWNLRENTLTRITDTPEYEGAPCWSPDGLWLAYETYAAGNLDIYIQSLSDLNSAPLQLTDDPGQDFAPAWSPEGRKIAFVSTRSGDADIWTAQLDQVEDRFQNISNNSGSEDSDPAWSPDGTRLVWAGQNNGAAQIYSLDLTQPNELPQPWLIGAEPLWSPGGTQILVTQNDVLLPAFAGFSIDGSPARVPVTRLHGAVHGAAWKNGELDNLVTGYLKQSPAEYTALYQRQYQNSTVASNQRFGMVSIPDLDVPYPYLQDSVDESFNAFRAELARQTGWDVLGSLENAYIPLTEAPNPGSIDEWLQTGRGFSINPLPIQAGWLTVVKEDRGGLTYWRVYARTRYQDGSQGVPLKARPWSLDLRYSGNPRQYEAGGDLVDIPEGYWVDVTEIAARYGWEALPALQNWRTYAPAARFTQFAFTDGLDWSSAMAQIYPAEALEVPTALPTFTITPSLTPTIRFYRSATPQPSATPTLEPTRRPTWTTEPSLNLP
jgi:TolB protein